MSLLATLLVIGVIENEKYEMSALRNFKQTLLKIFVRRNSVFSSKQKVVCCECLY